MHAIGVHCVARPRAQLIEQRSWGRYRWLPAGCIEVRAVGLMHTFALDGRQAGDVARGALEEFISKGVND